MLTENTDACESGTGFTLKSGPDLNKNDTLDDDEVEIDETICDGAQGEKGEQGEQGIQGEKGEKGDPGTGPVNVSCPTDKVVSGFDSAGGLICVKKPLAEAARPYAPNTYISGW